MTKNRTLWYMLPHKIKEVVDNLITAIEESDCFDTAPLSNIKKEITWTNTPRKIDSIIQYLKDNDYPTDIKKAQWYKLTNTVDELITLVDNFDCTNVPDNEVPSVPQNLTSSNITATSVALTWDASTDNRGVDHYNIYKDGSTTATRVGTAATISGLAASTTYEFRVSAVDISGNESGLSEPITVTTIA